MAKKIKKGEKIVILIVEDDEVLLRALFLLFHKSEYTIATATDGNTAVQMVQRLKPDVILLDLLLPDMNGFDVLRNLRSNPEFASLPIIILSNLGASQDVERAMTLGATDYFIKAKTDLGLLEEKIKSLF
jgi:DNA-binding response OmpR family regulator